MRIFNRSYWEESVPMKANAKRICLIGWVAMMIFMPVA